MSWRKYLVRSLVFSVLGGLAAAGWVYQRLTNPTVVRQQVIVKLESHFRDAQVNLGSAGLRLLGGISFSDLRVSRVPDGDASDLLCVPSGIIYHDKEQLLDGKLAIRKVELHRPRLRLVRGADGRWNTDRLLGPVDPNEPAPTIVIQRGTVLIEDRLAAPDAAPVEIKDVTLTVLNDPVNTLIIEAHGAAELLGELRARALYDRCASSLALTLEASAVPIGPALTQRLRGYCAELGDHLRDFSGVAHLKADLGIHPASPRPCTHDITCRLQRGRLEHPQLPLPLEEIEASVRCTDGRVRVEKIAASSGAMRLEAEGAASGLDANADFDGQLRLYDVPVTRELFARLPAKLQEVNRLYSPVGHADLVVDVARCAGQWRRRCVITTTDGQARFLKFPYPLERLQGRIEEQLDEAKQVDRVLLDLVGAGSGGRPVHIKGHVTGSGPRCGVEIDIWGDNVPLDDRLRAALAPELQKVANAFQPTGLADVVVQVRRPLGQTKWANRITARIHDGTVRYEVFPYPLENVRGVLEIHPDHWEFRDFHGSHKGGEFITWGRSHPVPGERDRISVTIRAKNLLLDEELEAALAPKLRSAWKSLALGGRMNVEAQVQQLPDRPEDIDVTVTARGCTMKPAFFPYTLTDVSGTVRYARGQVNLGKLQGRHGDTYLTLDQGLFIMKPAGGFWGRLTSFQGHPIVLDQDLVAALPPPMRKVCGIFQPGTLVGLTAEVVIDMPSEPNLPPDIYWDGGLSLLDATLEAGIKLEQVRGQAWCVGRHDGRQLQGLKGNILLDQAVLFRQPFREIHSHVLIAPEAPEVLRLPDLKARFFGGDIGGEMRVEFGPTVLYDVNLTALQVSLEQFGRHNLSGQEQWKGLASGRLWLTGRGSDTDGLEGHGQIDVPQGQIYNLPLLLDLIKMLGFRPMDRTAFEEAHAVFSIKGPKVQVTRLDLDGNAISLSGQGEMNLDGSDVQLDFYAVWGRIKQMLPPLFRDIPPAVGQQLLKIKMRGSVSDVKITKEPVPALVEPLERMLRRLSGTEPGPAARTGDLVGAGNR
ncbi:MAG: hypothetical protein JNM56_35670 [Planctomycetia bacterium]|nr:hypothetical protein [Planctomycetia bacterium]